MLPPTYGPGNTAAEPGTTQDIPDDSRVQADDPTGLTKPPGHEPTLDQRINASVAAIHPGIEPCALDEHIRDLAVLLVEANASGIVRDSCLEKINARVASLKLPKVKKTEWKRLIDEAAATDAVNNPRPAVTPDDPGLWVGVQEALPGAPVPRGVVVPPPWKLTAAGLYRPAAGQDVETLPTPLVIAARLLNDAEQTESVRLAWWRDGRWKEAVVPRHTIATRQSITHLAEAGLPVTSRNADHVIDYLHAFEAANLSFLPRSQVRRQLGWVDAGGSGFLWGHQYLTATPPASTATTAPGPEVIDPFRIATEARGNATVDNTTPDTGTVLFKGADTGDEQAAAGYHARGTFAEWKAITEPCLEYPVARLAVLASLGAPLLHLLADHGARNFTLDVCGETSKGKTTVLRVAASVWGMPDEMGSNSVVSTWHATRVGAERRASLVSGLPTFRDDTKQASAPEQIAQVLYDVTSGRSRDRGTVRGLDRTTPFATIMLITGESRAVSFSGDGGTRARVLTLWGAPFQVSDDKTAALITALNKGVLGHYGHAGPRFVQHLLDNRGRWQGWRERYGALKEGYVHEAQGNAVVGRLADAFALITLAGEIAGEALGIPQLAASPIEDLWKVLTDEASEADRATAALLHLWDWACANRDQFYDPPIAGHSHPYKQPPGGWAGWWRSPTGQAGGWPYIGVIPERLKRILGEAGFDFDAVVSTWKDRKWLRVDPSDRAGRYHQVLVGETKPRVVAVLAGAFRAAGCLAAGGSDQVDDLRGTARWFLRETGAALAAGDSKALYVARSATAKWLASLDKVAVADGVGAQGEAASLAEGVPAPSLA